METRASHILVGSFVLAFLAGLVAFAIWIAKVDLDAEYTDYDIYFDGTVSGLYKRSIVYYSGIPVGDVRDITLAPHDAQKVRVWVRLRSDVPVTKGAVARLEFQGLTGVAYIELKGGPPGGETIVALADQERAVIPAEASAFQAVYENAPDLITQAIGAVLQVQKLLSDENIRSVSSTLQNTDRLTGNLARGTDNIDALLAEATLVMQSANKAAEAITNLAQSGNTLLEDDGKRLVSEAIATMQSTRQMIDRIDALVAANEDGVTQFVGSSLPEVSRMIIDLRATAQSLSRLMSQLERDPAGMIFGPKQAEYDLKARKVKEEQQ
jgi:phospholipid/cholesterol/gamma-HCH transport system substrate-binding protein